MKKGEEFEEEPPEKEELDWWSKYYASLEEIERKVRNQLERKPSDTVRFASVNAFSCVTLCELLAGC